MKGAEVTDFMVPKKASMIGCAVGALLSLLSVLLMEISDVTLLGAYALLMLLLSASFTSSQREGVFFGLFAVIGESVMDFAYFLSGGAQVLLVPYAVGFFLFVGRIPLFPLMGALGGHLGQQYFADKKAKSRLRASDRASVGRKTRGKEGRSGERKKEQPD